MTPRLAIHNCLDNSPQYSLLLAHHGETEGALAEEFEALVGIERVVQARANISIKALQWQALEVRCAANRPQREIDRLDRILDRNHAGGQFPGMIRLVAGPKGRCGRCMSLLVLSPSSPARVLLFLVVAELGQHR
jgi:hypothetical protein